MKARIKSTQDSIILYLDGKIDYETQDTVCALIQSTLKRNQKTKIPKDVVISLENLEFVGSTGITQFVESLKAIHIDHKTPARYCHVRSEFQKIIRAFDEEDAFEFFDDETMTRKNGRSVIDH